MEASYVVGVDIGTQGTKTALYSTDGKLMAEAFAPSDLRRPGSGMVEEDPEFQFNSVCSTIKTCLESSRINAADVLCVALDGQMAGTIGIGSDGAAVTPYDSWLDTRCSPWIERMRAAADAELLMKTGNAPSYNQGPKILYWKHERPETYKKIAAFVQPGSYAAMRLCGLGADKAYVDDTYLHFSGFADNAAGCWDGGLCAEFGVEESKLPHIRKSADIVGRVCAEGGARSGLAAGTPVAAGLGDTAASFLSCGATEPGVCVDVAGTASVFATTTESFMPDVLSRTMGVGRSAVAGLWHPYAYINGGGMNLQWFAEHIAPGIAFASSILADYADLDALARGTAPAIDDPYFVPHMEGRVAPSDPGMHGAWAGLRWTHRPGHLYRAILESVGLEYRVYMNSIRILYPGFQPSEVRATGGGAKSRIWMEIKADILAVPFRPLKGQGGAPLGSAMVAAVAAGAAAGPKELASRWIAYGDPVMPRVEQAELCGRRFRNYERLLEALSGFPDA